MSNAPAISPRRHYIPQWMLHNFRSPILYELDIYTGRAPKQRVKVAASEAELWPQDIEDKIMTAHDTSAARIYQSRIRSQRRIVLNDSERYKFALWLALFMPRAPETPLSIQKRIDDEKTNPEVAIRMLYK